MIDSKEISIVIQGPLLLSSSFFTELEITKKVCERLRYLFPESELIFSTWEGTDIQGLCCDQVIFNCDPGATWFNYEEYSLLNNCNRLLVSTLAGIKAAKRKYILKVRSDLFLISKNFLNYFSQFPLYNENYKFVKNRIIAFSLFSLLGQRTCLFTMYRPYHVSDWAYFGFKEDLLDLFDIPLVPEPEFSQWFLTRCKPFYDYEPKRLWKMPPEQYITSSFFKKHIAIHLEHTADTSNQNMEMSEKLIVNNFLVLDQSQFSFISLKYLSLQLLFTPLLTKTAIFYSTWLKNYYTHMPIQSKSLKLKLKLIICYRKMMYQLINPLLRLFNYKYGFLNRLIVFFMKKI